MRTLHRRTAAVTALAAVTTTAAAPGRAEPYAAPGSLPVLSGAYSLAARFDAVARDILRAHSDAARAQDRDRLKALSGFLAPGRRFLSFDARGHGRAVEAVGDLARADRVAVVVPGADGLLTNFDSWKWAGGGARSLHRQAAAAAPGTRLAVVAWLGYDSPSTRSPAVLTDGRAADGARELTRFVGELHRVNGRAEVALLCHSYGSVVCGKAAPRLARQRLPVDEVALYGSPGVAAASAAALCCAGLASGARIWAGRSSGDWTRFVPKVRIAGIGLGHDPAAPSFGALRFDAGSGPHSAYLRPGSRSLRNLTSIALGRDPGAHDTEATHARNA
ncbi:alpha/beta hydrolase [Actinomadura rugatobispora]|uniref:Alpha/beta hydrolase n=1 Tax=Actinomadura rugatobispora TaxID=1994 RepID=A0ABW1A6F3_9ACTN|nr:alpha/beta hydrolase family protein [Actinomadura rugatobispora]